MRKRPQEEEGKSLSIMKRAMVRGYTSTSASGGSGSSLGQGGNDGVYSEGRRARICGFSESMYYPERTVSNTTP
jgi:hypothetical protein